jgi:hypothetical protein
MAKNSVRDYSATNSSNTDIQSIDISEGCSPAGINNAVREIMVDLKNVSTGAVALETPSADQLNVDNLRLDGNTISSTDTNGNVQIDPAGTGVVDVVGTLQSDGLTVDGDVTLNDGSPNLRLKDTDTNRFVDLMYGTRVSTIRNTMASGEDMDTVEPSMVFSFKDDGETRTAMTIDHDAATTIHSSGGATPTYSHTNNGEGLTFRYNDDSGARAADIVATGNTPAGATMAMRFFTNPASTDAAAEVMRIQNGKLLIGTTSVSSGILNAVYTGSYGIDLRGASGASTLQLFFAGSTNVGSISTNGSSTAFNTSSDYRLKENVTATWDATTRLKQLNPVRFNFIADADTTVDGFLAHEAQTVVPEAVTGTHNEVEVWKEGEELPDGVSVGDNKLDDDGNTIPVMQGIDQAKIVPLLTKALIESVEKIEQLEARITALEAE